MAAMNNPDDDDAPLHFQEIVRESGMLVVPSSAVVASYGVELEEWLGAMWAELNSLQSKGVFERLTAEEARLLNPRNILPMKLVLGIKSADAQGYRKKKVRAVVCGNFQQRDANEELYTANADISTVRMALAESAHKGWSVGSLDVNTAFLNADLPPDTQDIFVRPPQLMVRMGLIEQGEVWRAVRAIYGLRVSPRAWAIARDQQLTELRFECDGKDLKLRQSAVDNTLWIITPAEEPEQESDRQVLGYCVTYVDDFLYFGPTNIVHALEECLKTTWVCTTQPVLVYGQGGELKYLGMFVKGKEDGYELHQAPYVQDMLQKWGLDSCNGAGSINMEAPEEEELPEEPDLGEVRMAQKISGGLLWLSCRTRPDISFATSRVSSQATTRPRWAMRLGKKILRYIAGTKKHGLHFRSFGTAHLVVYADASFDVATSQTGIAVFWRGILIDWRSLKQPQVARSTAEAEITALATGGIILEGAEATLNSLCIVAELTKMLGDNSASLCLGHGQGTWRSRALTNRAHGIKTRVQQGLWQLDYVATTEQVGDGFTKFLCVTAMSKFRQQLGLHPMI